MFRVNLVMFSRLSLLTLGVSLLVVSVPQLAFAFDSAEFAISEICGHMEGNLGALLMSVAGVGAVVSAAMGNFRAAFTCLIVGIGAFGTSAMMSFYFPDAAEVCVEGAENGGGDGLGNGLDNAIGDPATNQGPPTTNDIFNDQQIA